MPKLYTLYVFCLWYISSSHEAVAERLLDFRPDAHIRCPGLPLAEYCDCTGDCDNHPDYCACEEAQSCCSAFQTNPVDDDYFQYDNDGFRNFTDSYDQYDDDVVDCRDLYGIDDPDQRDCDDQYRNYLSGSDKPEVIFHIVGMCSASLSMIGSFLILLKIIRGIRSTSPYDRFILGLSTFDILASIMMLVDHFLVPDKTTVNWRNPRESCGLLGALSKFFTLLSVWYNGLLSVYFLLRVLSQLKRKDLVKKYEIWLHISGILDIALLIFLFWSFWGDIAFYDFGSTCYIIGEYFVWDFYGLISVFLIIINYTVIYGIVVQALRSNHGPSPEQNRRKREVTTLMILYVGSFFVTFAPSLVWGYISALRQTIFRETFPLRLLVAATYPLQGFLNAFIFFKPAYTRFRASLPSKSIFFVLYQVLLSRSAPKSYHHRDGQHVTAGSVYITDITRADTSSTVPVDSNANTEDHAGDGVTGVDFGSTIFVEADPVAEDDNFPLEVVVEEEPVDSNS